ncbi:hypothetical protein BDZ91DRAFT_722969 [Kalaharituber pfeilii]|nr:hypothetical protein BDZ91DRAFT_722969 [Kalaharituber pfeilii]
MRWIGLDGWKWHRGIRNGRWIFYVLSRLGMEGVSIGLGWSSFQFFSLTRLPLFCFRVLHRTAFYVCSFDSFPFSFVGYARAGGPARLSSYNELRQHPSFPSPAKNGASKAAISFVLPVLLLMWEEFSAFILLSLVTSLVSCFLARF